VGYVNAISEPTGSDIEGYNSRLFCDSMSEVPASVLWVTTPNLGQKVPLDFCLAIYTSVRLHTQYSYDVVRRLVAGYQAVVLESAGSVRCNISPIHGYLVTVK
jgi:hypothetical protein